MLVRLTDTIQAIQHVLHAVKPLLFELVLFTWAAYEMVRFLMATIGGHGA